MTFGMEMGLGPGHSVLDREPAPLPKRGTEHPLNSRPILLWQTAGCIKMPLGMEMGLSPGDFVIDVDPDPIPKKGRGRSPNFWPTTSIVAKRLRAL